VAEALAVGLSAEESSVSLTDLADTETSAGLSASIGEEKPTCLFVGSPVYFSRAVPPVMAFIEDLTPSDGAWAAPFVTYGVACSGIALWQMASALSAKGYRIAGAAKVLAVHSLMWESDEPVGGGHPDEAELAQIRDFAATLDRRFESGSPEALDLGVLDYHRAELSVKFRSAMGDPFPIMPKAVDGEVCTECGICAEECPVGTITLNPFPEFGESCIDCFNCVRLCPEEAITPETSLAEIGEMVRDWAREVHEPALTQLFMPPLLDR
jgi:ferredoxin